MNIGLERAVVPSLFTYVEQIRKFQSDREAAKKVKGK